MFTIRCVCSSAGKPLTPVVDRSHAIIVHSTTIPTFIRTAPVNVIALENLCSANGGTLYGLLYEHHYGDVFNKSRQ